MVSRGEREVGTLGVKALSEKSYNTLFSLFVDPFTRPVGGGRVPDAVP